MKESHSSRLKLTAGGVEREEENGAPDFIDRLLALISDPIARHRTLMKRALYSALLGCWFVYFGFAMACRLEDEGSMRLLSMRLRFRLY